MCVFWYLTSGVSGISQREANGGRREGGGGVGRGRGGGGEGEGEGGKLSHSLVHHTTM